MSSVHQFTGQKKGGRWDSACFHLTNHLQPRGVSPHIQLTDRQSALLSLNFIILPVLCHILSHTLNSTNYPFSLSVIPL